MIHTLKWVFKPKWVKFGPDSAQNWHFWYSFANRLIFFSDFFAESWNISTLMFVQWNFSLGPKCPKLGQTWILDFCLDSRFLSLRNNFSHLKKVIFQEISPTMMDNLGPFYDRKFQSRTNRGAEIAILDHLEMSKSKHSQGFPWTPHWGGGC